MTAEQPLYIGTPGSTTYDAQMMRNQLAAFIAGRNYETFSPSTGAIARGHGVLTSDALKVTANTSPNNFVNISPGIASVRGTQSDDQGAYLCPILTNISRQISGKDSTSTRIDLVVAQVRDNEYPTFSNDDWDIDVVEGTPGSGDPTVPEDSLVLARITVNPGSPPTVITSADIEDLRPQARANGGITPLTVTSEFPSPQAYEVVYQSSTDELLLFDGASWVTIGKDLQNQWTSWGSKDTRWNNVTFGANGSSYGFFSRLGKTVIGVAGFEVGPNHENPVTGALSLNLPSEASPPGFDRSFLGGGRMYTGGLSGVFWSCIGRIRDSSPTLLDFFGSLGTDPWDANSPVVWTEGAHMRVFFMYREV